MEFVVWVSLPLNILFFHLSLINIVSVYGNPGPGLCKSAIVSLETIFLYIFNDSKTWENEGSEFEIKNSMLKFSCVNMG